MTDSNCLRKMKKKLGFPHTIIEISDVEILQDIIHDEALKTFSTYFPAEAVIRREEMLQDSRYEAVYRFPEEYEGRIISVKNVLNIGGKTDFQLIDNHSIRIYNYDDSLNGDSVVINAKVIHKKDLSTIPINQEDIFLEYCTILLAEQILPIKKEFARLGSQIGDIEMSTDVIEKYADKKDDFKTTNFYNSAKLSKRFPLTFSAPYAGSNIGNVVY